MSKKERNMGQIFVAFSEYLNFINRHSNPNQQNSDCCWMKAFYRCQIDVAISNLANARAISCWQFVLHDSYSLKIINFDLLRNLEQTFCLRLNNACRHMILPDNKSCSFKNLKYIHLSTHRFSHSGCP